MKTSRRCCCPCSVDPAGDNAPMTSCTRSRMVALLGAATLSMAALAGCGGDSAATTATSGGTATSAGGTATLTDASGGAYTVTLAEGVTTPIEPFGNDGSAPVGFWAASSADGVKATVGTPFGIELAQSPSTGYSWKAVGGTALGTQVTLVQEWVLADDTGPGSPGTHYWVYNATAAGTGTLVFEEFPPGEDTPSKTQAFTVTVTS